MRERLVQLLGNSYTSSGGVSCAAIVEMGDGTLFSGVNVKNAVFRDAIYAEQAAIGSAVTAGYQKSDFKKLYFMIDASSFQKLQNLNLAVIREFFLDDGEVILLNRTLEEKRFLVRDLKGGLL